MQTWLLIGLLATPILGGLVAWRLGKRAGMAGILSTLLALVMSLLLLSTVSTDPTFIRWEFAPGIQLGFQLDRLGTLLTSLVCFIALMVQVFSQNYMRDDPGIHRYFAFLGFFISSMLGLLLADHVILLFVFWELVGFSSFLLIGFWYRDVQKAKAAREAFMVNRLADAGLLVAVILLVAIDQPYLSSFGQTTLPVKLQTIIGIGLLIGAMGKSAQFPFFGWLPKAMAGPTPVSALIHAATMVTAGVYLLIRAYPVMSDPVLTATAAIGGLTALMAAIAALTQHDLKKVLAYSTISQLGYMVLGVGVGAFQAAAFHLWTHAFFKAGLFLAAGVVIHFMHRAFHDGDGQDMRHMGGLRKLLPVTFVTYAICGLALSGLPFFSGFLSKEGILSGVLFWSVEGGLLHYIVAIFAFATALLTPIYIGRQILLVFMGDQRKLMISVDRSEPLWTVKLPLLILAGGSLWFFNAMNPFDAKGWWFNQFLFLQEVIPYSDALLRVETYTLVLSVILALTGLALSYYWYQPKGVRALNYANQEDVSGGLAKWSYYAFYVEKSYQYLSDFFLRISANANNLDRKVIDKTVNMAGVGVVVFSKFCAIIDREIVDGLVNFSAFMGRLVGRVFSGIQFGSVQNQLVWLVAAIIAMVIWFQF